MARMSAEDQLDMTAESLVHFERLTFTGLGIVSRSRRAGSFHLLASSVCDIRSQRYPKAVSDAS